MTPASGADLERAQFLAWPFGHAVWLRAKTKAEARHAAQRLRAKRDDVASVIGLVINEGDDDATRESAGDLREALIKHEMLRRGASVRAAEEQQREAMRAATFPVELEPVDVLVLPRVDVLRRPDQLGTEIMDIVRDVEVLPLHDHES